MTEYLRLNPPCDVCGKAIVGVHVHDDTTPRTPAPLTRESQRLLANAFGSPRCIPEYLVRTALPLIEAKARTPLLAEIEQLKAKIDRLEDRIDRLEDSIEGLDDEIEDFDESLSCDEPGCYGEVTCGWPTRPGGTGPNGGYRQTCIEHYIAHSDREGYWP